MDQFKEIFKLYHGAIDMADLKPMEKEVADRVVEMTDCMRSELFELHGKPVWIHRGLLIEVGHILAIIDSKGFLGNEDPKDMEKMLVRTMQDFREDVDESLAAGDYVRWFGIMDKRLIIPMLVQEVENIPEDKLYDVFVEVYQRSEYGFGMLKPILGQVIASAHHSKERDKRLRHLKRKKPGKTMKVFRGMTEESDPEGMSWTTDPEVAKRFSRRFRQGGWVSELRITHEDVLDFITDRGESEILLAKHIKS